jgi:hypothetical protein
VFCKKYHDDHGAADAGQLRGAAGKSRCPGWARPDILRQRLIDEALVDPDGGTDSYGRPRRLWTAVNGVFFVGVSTNENVPRYNCYPDVPASALVEELAARAQRSVSAV